MKKIFAVLSSVLLMLSLNACTGANQELTNVAIYEDWQLELQTAEVFTDDEGNRRVRVNAVYTNDSQEPLYALCSFAVRAFQNDIELNDYSDINGGEAELIREVKNGKSINVSYVFDYPQDTQIEVLVGSPTADMETLGKQTYFSEEE